MSAPCLRVLSLGGGTQSCPMALMADAGVFGDRPDFAVFSDTQREPRWVAEQVEYVRAHVTYPVVTVTAGDLGRDVLDYLDGTRKRVAQLPIFTRRGTVRYEDGQQPQQCTGDYKIAAVRAYVTREMERRGIAKRPGSVEMWVGLSVDEIHRVKPADVKWAVNRWPLVEAGLRKADTARWMEENGHPTHFRGSRCVHCPHQDRRRWRELHDHDPAGWAFAVQLDRRIRRYPGLHGEAFLDRSRQPLEEIDLSTSEERGQGELDLAGECSGACFT